MSYRSKVVDLTMGTNADRFVTPLFVIPSSVQGAMIHIPVLDDACNIFLQAAPYPHRYNYPMRFTDYASDDIILELDFDDADGTTIRDRVGGVVLTEQGNPTFQASAAVAGLGKGLTLDGTGDQFDVLTSGMAHGFVYGPKGAYPETGDFAVELVFNLTSAAGGAADTLIALRNGAGGVGWAIQLDANEHLDIVVEDADGTDTCETDTDIATDAIVHLGVNFDRDGAITPYVNGAALTPTAAVAMASYPKTLWPGIGAACRLAIGGDAARTATSVITGTVYFARIYNKILGAARWLENYRTLIGGIAGLGYPGWTPVIDPADGADFIVNASGSDPGQTIIPPRILNTIKGRPVRLVCATEQTTTPAELLFKIEYS